MKFKESASIKDQVRTTVYDKYGKIKSDRIQNNGLFHRFLVNLGLAHDSITNTGMAALSALIGAIGSPPPMIYIGIGTGTTAASPSDTWLGTAVTIQQATSATRVTTTQTNDTLQLVFTFGSGGGQGSLSGTKAITEVVVTNGVGGSSYTVPSSNICLLRQVYSPADTCDFTAGDTIVVTVKIQNKQGS
jgi:hypothetical protein